jgi:ABC-type multidrug transport system ATPase subunit
MRKSFECIDTGEMLVGTAKALFMDEISTGLDSSTTFQVVQSVKQSVHHLNGTAVISLLQPPPETYDLFDDIILLSEGHIVYQGPCEHVLQFFASLGFMCPQRKSVADFLQEVSVSLLLSTFYNLRSNCNFISFYYKSIWI